MHIKQVLVEGFKSYKDQTRTEPFSNKLNTIVGANGAGKSNFFQAIRFVLDADVSSLPPQERQKLLHEGAGHAVVTAFVEIVLDNSDGRIQVEKEEVRLRRTIGLKKDEYQLNKKRITKAELSDILESAGFSKANPYYVVQQGKIMALSMMKDEERLDLLKEIGGSKVYEDRRMESLKVIQDADGRTQQIAELVSEMEAKLKQLDAEREELAKYQSIDREVRSLEYAIHDKEVSDAGSRLEQIERQRQEEAERAGQALDEQEAAQAALKRAEKELRHVAAEQAKEQARLKEISSEKDATLSRKAQVDLDVADLEERREAAAATQKRCQRELKALEKEIAQADKRLDSAKKALDEKQAVTEGLLRRSNEAQRRQEALDTKQGNRQNFATIKERNDHIMKEMKLREDGLRKLQEQIQDLQAQISAIEQSRIRLKEGVVEKRREIANFQQEHKDRAVQKRELEAKRNATQNKRQELRKKGDDLVDRRKQLHESIKRLESKVDPKSRRQQQALSNVRELSKTYNVPLHGTILELIDTLPQLYLAVEVAAGGSLYHLVVDTDEQASTLLRRLRENGGGRITCLPLNNLHVDAVKYTEAFGDEALPLTKYLSCAAEVKRAIDQVFGKWMICKDSDVASRVIATTRSINCVTISGDVHSGKGTITGGHREEKRNNKLQTYKQKVKEEQELGEVLSEQAALEQAELECDSEVTAIMSDIYGLDMTLQTEKAKLEDLQASIRADTEELAGFDGTVQSKRKAIAENEELLRVDEQRLTDLNAELSSKELGKLSQAEIQEKSRLGTQILKWKEELHRAQAAQDMAEATHAEVQATLSDNLLKRKAEIESQLSKLSTPENREQADTKKRDAQEVEENMRRLVHQQNTIQQNVDSMQQKAQELQAEAERCRELQKSGNAEGESNAVAQLLAKRSTLLQKKADHEKKIRELGSLPADAFEKYQGKSLADVNKLLAKAQKQLKKYGHVNKKALDQYLNFTEQKEELVKRHDETVRGKDKIQQLIHNLDLRKDEAIERTFKGVAKNFREIFAELAPGGKGELVMQKANPPQPALEAEEASAPPSYQSFDRYSGVKVKVSFGSGETMSLKQLSGGQKTLVALALIFSIQRLDPAPFYLFDEIDAALDPAYRATVAKMLARQANDPTNPSQFIITTFHSQIVHESDQVYGVSHSARISTIDAITKEDALEFLNTEERTTAKSS